MTNIIEVISL